jgi:hypothetical protein
MDLKKGYQAVLTLAYSREEASQELEQELAAKEATIKASQLLVEEEAQIPMASQSSLLSRLSASMRTGLYSSRKGCSLDKAII